MTMAIGKRKLVVDLNCFDPRQERHDRWWTNEGITATSAGYPVDLFRAHSYNVWGLLKKNEAEINLSDMHYLKGRGTAPYSISLGTPLVDNSSIFPLVTQTITLKADRSKFKGAGWPVWWEKYIKGGTYEGNNNSQIQDGTVLSGIIQEDVGFTDHAFEIQTPYDEKELGAYSSIGRPVQIKLDPVYNFFNEQYENISNDSSIPETILPNLYVFTSYKDNSDKPDVNPAYADLITLNGGLPKNILKLTGGELRNRYYSAWAPKAELISAAQIELLNRKGLNSAVPLAEVQKFNHYGEMRSEFPMYVDLSFSTDTETIFADALEDSKLDVAFLADVMKETIPDIGNEMAPYPMIELSDNPYLFKTELGGTVIRKNPAIRHATSKTLDITDWMSKFIDYNDETLEMELIENTSAVYTTLRDRVDTFATFLGTTLDNDSILTNPKYEPFKRLMIMILSGKVRKLITNKFRTFEEVLNGKIAYSETVLYRITKVGPDGNLVQNIYIPNSSNIDVFRFVDTQVKYNKDYMYTIYAYQLVVGTQYEYLDVLAGWRDQGEMGASNGEKNNTAKVTVAYTPSVKLFEIPYHSTTRIVLDAPPLIPDVDIIPYRGEENKIQIRLNGSTGRYVADPIIIEPEDVSIINRIREAARLDPDDPITFNADDFVSSFQVFRSTTKPTSYLDMRGKLRTILNTDKSAQTPQQANSAEMNDLIVPNQKYYYTFRAVDKHAHISNPTAIYEVELVKQNGSIYPAISVVEFAQPPKASTKSMRRYLHIKPNMENSLIDREDLGSTRVDGKDIERVKLGIGDDRIWGKKFKIRLTSKNSGKKIDFNLDFTTKHIKPGDS